MKTYEVMVNKLKTQHKNEIRDKDREIKAVSDELCLLKNSLIERNKQFNVSGGRRKPSEIKEVKVAF